MLNAKDKAQTVQDMLAEHQTTMLVTHDQQGGLVSRPMTTQRPDEDGTVWFFVSSDADVIDEITANSDVNIAYASDGNYVSVSGNATIVNDIQKKQNLWYDDLAQWFDSNSPDSPDVLLVKVEADTARFWSAASGGSDDGQQGYSGRVNY